MPRKPHTYDHLAAFALEHPWAVTPQMLTIIAGTLARRVAGMEADDEAIARAHQARDARDVTVRGGGLVAVIPIMGVIAPRMNLLSEMSGGTTFEALTKQLQAAVADPEVKTIVFDVDSPGGNVAGASEFAREVLRARATKPIIVQAHHLLASAAYWAMAGATEIVATPSAHVGSIGVFAMHDDLTEAFAQIGLKREVIAAGKYKAEALNGSALSDEARGHLQHLIDGSYNRMVGDIAKGRGVSAADVRNGYGEGRALTAEDALAAGLIDRIATCDDTLARVTQPATAGRVRVAAAAPPAITEDAASSQESRVVSAGAQFAAFERRVLDLHLRRLAS
jgi:signal peptide peptidase SppA